MQLRAGFPVSFFLPWLNDLSLMLSVYGAPGQLSRNSARDAGTTQYF
jgi:hypothetical protein